MSLLNGLVSNAQAASYQPPRDSVSILGNVSKLIQNGREIDRARFVKQKVKYICKLPGGQLYFESGLNVDDDGDSSKGFPTNWKPQIPPHQSQTTYSNSSGYLNPIQIPYIVLPGALAGGRKFYEEQGVKKGDGAVVIWKSAVVFAVFGDVGPGNQLGEASLATIKALDPGWSPFVEDLHDHQIVRTVNSAHPNEGVITIVFPGTSQGNRLENLSALQDSIKLLFGALSK